MAKKLLTYLSLSVLSGLLLAYSWPYIGDLEWMIFFAFIPLLWMERKISEDKPKYTSGAVFAFSYLSFLIFNVITTWWIKLASPGGMVLAVVFNSLFMAIIFTFFHFTRRNINDKVGYASLILYWVAFEYLHINWELSWIWLTLGNVFANRITWIQWYEYTGTLGGSLWILSVNLLIFYSLVKASQGETNMRHRLTRVILLMMLLAGPMIVSKKIYKSYLEKEDPVEIVVVQPNIDPYKDKFYGMHEYDQIDRLMELTEEKVTPNTDLVFGPETAFPLGYWEHELEYIYGTEKVREFLDSFPNVKYVVGLSTIRLYVKGEEMSPTSRLLNDGSGNQYDLHNTVMQVEKDKDLQIYRKSQLVLGVERMPFTGKFKILEKLSIKLGGASGSLGVEKEPLVFSSKTIDGRDLNVIPAICYESIYSEYLTEFVKKGGNILGVVTNDGWWGNTPGFGQHMSYSRLRAIELRRSVARSANTGISALINQRGEILQQSEWWTQDALRGKLNLNSEITFYAANGDFVGRIAAFFAVLMFFWMLVKRVRGKL